MWKIGEGVHARIKFRFRFKSHPFLDEIRREWLHELRKRGPSLNLDPLWEAVTGDITNNPGFFGEFIRKGHTQPGRWV
jgi:hypothetical protein